MAYTLADVLSQILTGIQDTLYYIASAIAENAATIATVAVVGGLSLIMVRFGTRIWRTMAGMFRAFII